MAFPASLQGGIEMPIEIELYFEELDKTQFELLHVNNKTNFFTIDVPEEPTKITIDPNMWVLMDVVEFGKER